MKIYNPQLSGISTGFGIPIAGTSGQVLSKVDSDNYDTQWVTPELPQKIVVKWNNKNSTSWNPNFWTKNGDVSYEMRGDATFQSQYYGIRLTRAVNALNGVVGLFLPTSTFNPANDFYIKLTLIYNSSTTNDPADGYSLLLGGEGINHLVSGSTKGIRIAVNPYSGARHIQFYNGNTLLGQYTSTFNSQYTLNFEWEIRKYTLNGRTYIAAYNGGYLDSEADVTGLNFNFGERFEIGAVTGGSNAAHWFSGIEIWQ